LELAAIPRARCGPAKPRRLEKTDDPDRGYIAPDYVDLTYALHGGDDYELLFTSSRPVPNLIKGVPITRIGQILIRKDTPVQKMAGKKAPGKKTSGPKAPRKASASARKASASVATRIKTIDERGRSRVLKPRGWEHFSPNP